MLQNFNFFSIFCSAKCLLCYVVLRTKSISSTQQIYRRTRQKIHLLQLYPEMVSNLLQT